MELKKGYKHTEVGVIPENWDVKPLKEVSFMKGRIGWQGLKQTEFTTNADDPFLITGMNFKDGVIRWDEVYHVSHERYQIAKEIQLKQNDVLMTKDGTIGKLLYVDNIPYPGTATLNSHLLVFRPIKDSYAPKYLYFQLSSKIFKDHIELSKSGSTFFGISQEAVGEYKAILPPFAEQTAIAAALSDADALIQSLEKVIAKKRLIKQGTMQELLKPKDGWVVKALPEVCWFQEGPGVRNSQFTHAGVKLLNGTNIEDGKLLLEKTDRYISEREVLGWYSHFMVNDGDIIIACSGVTIEKFHEKVTIVSEIHLPLCMNTSTMRFKVTSNILSKNFFFHFLKSRSFKEQIGGKATGSAQLNFGPSHVKMVEISLPTLDEQTRIATILSDMDAEISALETKLAKYQQIKQGMMQNLLTGKIRLV